MGIVAVPNTFSSNTTISSSEVNSNFTTLYNEFNGSIEAANVAAGAITAAKLATDSVETAKIKDANVTTAKIASDAVTTAKVNDGAITSEKLSATVAFHAYAPGTQTISSTSTAKITLDSEEFDTGSNFDATTNYRFTAPKAGYYHFSGTYGLGNQNDGKGGTAYLYKNGSEIKQGARYSTGGAGQISSTVNATIELAASDYVELYGTNGDSTSRTVGGQTDTYFSGFLIGE